MILNLCIYATQSMNETVNIHKPMYFKTYSTLYKGACIMCCTEPDTSD